MHIFQVTGLKCFDLNQKLNLGYKLKNYKPQKLGKLYHFETIKNEK